ncbi:hypothetical protein [Sorangium sp. So ce406]|uniref:hypothetical protein n=1 Tax=Sorangium sp. So ce406 TaxID=3133311 RepID=UPI003F5CB056
MASRLRAALAAGVMAASILTAQDVLADPKDDGLEEQVKACNDNVAYFRSRIDDVVLWSNVFMIAGAIISAVGSGLAGFLNSAGRRKAAAIAGALGAVLTVTPKALPDKERLLASLSSAEKHRLVGTKIRNQFQFARPDESLVDAQKYVSARFTDCASLDPPQGVPELPSMQPISSGQSMASTQALEEPVSSTGFRGAMAMPPNPPTSSASAADTKSKPMNFAKPGVPAKSKETPMNFAKPMPLD